MSAPVRAASVLVLVRVLASAGACCALGACGAADDATAVSLSTPRALACANAPALQARLWVSGTSAPCALDVAGAATSGTCTTAPGRKRTLTLDWFVDEAGVTLLLAQARGTLDLTVADKATADFNVADTDVVTAGCRDMTNDQVEGNLTIKVAGVDVPPCDVDNSCAGGDGACTNLGEVCAQTNPFDPASEP